MTPINGGYTRLQFSIPSRGLIGYRGEFLTDTKEMVLSIHHLKDMNPIKVIFLIEKRVLLSLMKMAKR